MGRGTIIAATVALGLSGAAAAERPLVPIVVPGTSEVAGLVGRSDGAFPFGFDASTDRARCLLERRSVTLGQLRAVLRIAKANRAGAFRETLRITQACMERRGWRFVGCGTDGAPDCPVPTERGPSEDPLDVEHAPD